MSDDFQSSEKWIEETRQKLDHFESPVIYLTKALELLEDSCFESNSLKNAFVGFRQDLFKCSQSVCYQRDELISWIDDVLNTSKRTKCS